MRGCGDANTKQRAFFAWFIKKIFADAPGAAPSLQKARTILRRRYQVIRKPGHRQLSLAAERTCSAPSIIDLPVLHRRVARHLDVDGRTLGRHAGATGRKQRTKRAHTESRPSGRRWLGSCPLR